MAPMPFFQPLPEPEPAPRESARFYRNPWDPPDNALPGLGPAGLLLANRRLNHAMHMIAVTQRHNDTPGRSYYSREVPIGSGVWERRVDQQEAQGCFRRRASPAAGAR